MKFSFPTALFVILLVIKLLKPAAITWFWVFAPLWMGFPIIFAILMVCAIIVAAAKS